MSADAAPEGERIIKRTIFHLEVPEFAVTVERVRNRSLVESPVLIAPPGNGRALVLALSRQARDCGIVTGMRLESALKLCSQAVVLPPDRLLYRRAADAVSRLLGDFTPVSEHDKSGRFFMDMTGTDRLFGPPQDAAARIRREVQSRLLLPSSFGIAVNKCVSKVASSVIRDELLNIIPGCERPFLSPWEVGRLPGIDQVPDPRLFGDLNIQRIGELAAYPVGQLATAFGKMAPILNQRAQGIDPTPVLAPTNKPMVREEEILGEDSNNTEELLARLFTLTERCGYRLRTMGVAARTVALMLGYTDNMTQDGRARVSPPTMDDGSLFTAMRPLFKRVAFRRVRVRYLALTFSDLCPGSGQLRLFVDRGRDLREKSLTCAMDRIRDRFGIGAISRGNAA